MQDAINLALEGTDDFINANPDLNRYVATFGNSEPEQTGDWVPILEFPGGTVGVRLISTFNAARVYIGGGPYPFNF